MRSIRTAVIGCGTISETRHIPAAIKLPEIDLTALVDQNLQRAKRLGKKFNIAHCFRDYKEITDSIELAIVATPNSSHAAICSDCLRSGIHVFCEKPMAISVKECESMIGASEEGRSKLMIGHYMRYTSNVILARQLINEHVLGNIKMIEGSFGYAFKWQSATNFYNSSELAGGGVLIDTGVHLFDLVYYLTGLEGIPVYYSVHDEGTGGAEREVDVELELDKGMICLFSLSRNRKLPNTMKVIGDKGWLKVYLGNYRDIEVCRFKRKIPTNDEPICMIGQKFDPYLKQLEAFVESIMEDKAPPVSGADGKRTLTLVETCYSSLSH